MKSKEYRSILGQLPLKNPTPEDMARLCPHLTQNQAAEAFMSGEGYVACPSLRVSGAFQMVCYRKEYVEEVKVWKDGSPVIVGRKNHPSLLENSHASRTLASYANGHVHGDVFCQSKHMEEAMSFAEKNWPEDLILDDWESVMEIYIQDPTDLVNDRYHRNSPRTKAILYVALGQDLNKVINDHSKPASILFDEAISEITTDRTIWHELRGGRGGFTDFNCAHCAGGLMLSSCHNCGHRFHDDHMRCGHYTPLSRKMVASLRQSGHIFKMDPEIAWKKESEEYTQARKEYASEMARRQS